MDHRQLKMRGRIVDRDSRVLRDAHNDEGDEGESERDAQTYLRSDHVRSDRRELS